MENVQQIEKMQKHSHQVSTQVTTWDVLRQYGPAGAFHERTPAQNTGHEVWVRTIPRPALVLGSTQPDTLVRTHEAQKQGIEVCRRRSGGGLVWLDPATDCWIDVIIPVESPLWEPDIGRAFHWLGDLWASVLASRSSTTSSAGELAVHGGGAAAGAGAGGGGSAGRVWCFADLGHGEISIGGSKVLGLSQRRTRTWARLQGLVLGAWPGDSLADYIDLDVAATLAPAVPPAELQPGQLRAGFPDGISPPSPTELADRFLRSLTET